MVRKSELLDCFISPNENDRNLEAANVVDGLFAIARSINAVAEALGFLGSAKQGEHLGAIELLSMSVEDGLDDIAKAIRSKE